MDPDQIPYLQHLISVYTVWYCLSVQILRFLFVLRIYGPVNKLGSCWVQSVYQSTLFPRQVLSSKRLTSACAHSFTRNWQLPFLNQQMGESGPRKYFMTNFHKRMLWDPVEIKPAMLWSPFERTSDWATEACRYLGQICGTFRQFYNRKKLLWVKAFKDRSWNSKCEVWKLDIRTKINP